MNLRKKQNESEFLFVCINNFIKKYILQNPYHQFKKL